MTGFEREVPGGKFGEVPEERILEEETKKSPVQGVDDSL